MVLALRPPAETADEQGAAPAVLRMQLVGAQHGSEGAGEEPLAGVANYFLGDDPARWRTGVPTYAKVRYQEVYPGVDLVYYGNQGQLEYDFVVAPGADPSAIALRWEGAEAGAPGEQGDLILHTAGGALRQRRPVVYQESDGYRQEVEGGYLLREDGQIRFAVGTYDLSRPLVIDPTLVYSTYLGGSGTDESRGIALDGSGNVYLAGQTTSANFPTANARQLAPAGNGDAFLAKLNAVGTALVFSTCLGGSGTDYATGVRLDPAGNLYVAGSTGSPNFPTLNPIQTSGGGFVTKLDA